MTSAEFKKNYPQCLYDYIYVDGDHSYEGVKLDYNLFWPNLIEGGLMVFHDVIVKGFFEQGKCKYGVYKFWEELNNRHKITFPFPKNSGLGILQK
jgi:predicted O-methyltransferase YrrM